MGWVSRLVSDPVGAITDNKFTSTPAGILTGVALIATAGASGVFSGSAAAAEGAGDAALDSAVTSGLASEAPLPVSSLLGDAGGSSALDGLNLGSAGISSGAGGGLGALGNTIDPNMYGPINVPTDPSALNTALNSPTSGLPTGPTNLATGNVPSMGTYPSSVTTPGNAGMPGASGTGVPIDPSSYGNIITPPINPGSITSALNDPSSGLPTGPTNLVTAPGAPVHLPPIDSPASGTPWTSATGMPSLGSLNPANLLGSIADIYRNRNTADNSAAYLQAMKDAAATNQANAAKYTGKLDDLASLNQNNNTAYLAQMNGIAGQNQTADTNYVSNINGLADQGRTANAGYISSLNNLYAPGSPEVLAMQRQMDAQDAASGRNSQYGTRAVDLAAKLAPIRANIMENPAYTSALQNTAPNALQTSQGYLNAMHGTGATDIYNSTGYNAALGNKSVNDIMASPAYANTVNNTAMMNTLMSTAYQNANTTGVNAQNNQYNSLLASLGQMFNTTKPTGGQ